MRIETYCIDRLKKSLECDELWGAQRIAISKNRALSAIHNPRARSNDVILAAAFNDNKLVGYHGALPDTMYIDNAPINFAWGSCWWVDDELRGKRLGSLLKEKLVDCWEHRFASRDVSPDALRSLKKSGLAKEFRKELGTEFQFEIITARESSKNDGIQYWDKKANLPKDYKIEYLSQLDMPSSDFISRHNTKELFRREAKELNWISLYPWCSQEPECQLQTLQNDYYFDLKFSRFFNTFVKVIDSTGSIKCLAMLLLCNQRLSAPYIYHTTDSLEILCTVIGKHIVHLGVESFRTYNQQLIDGLKSVGPPATTLKQLERHTLFSPDLHSLPHPDIPLQDGDGDCAFWI